MLFVIIKSCGIIEFRHGCTHGGDLFKSGDNHEKSQKGTSLALATIDLKKIMGNNTFFQIVEGIFENVIYKPNGSKGYRALFLVLR